METNKPGEVLSGYNPTTRVFEIRKLFVRHLPEYVTGIPVEMIPGKGTPTEIYVLLRQMKKLGVEYGGLKGVRVLEAEDPETLVQLETQVRAGVPVAKAIEETWLYEAARVATLQAGHQVVPGSLRLLAAGQRERLGEVLERHDRAGWLAPYGDDRLFAKYRVDASYEVTSGFGFELALARFEKD
jgi:hypothetical protein